MFEVLREGRSEGRVDLSEVALTGAIAVGALEGLAGEVTVVDGRVAVAVADSAEGITVRAPLRAERAALLFLAQVESWEEIPLPDCDDYVALEDAIAGVLARRQFDLTQPCPLRVRGVATALQFHVIAGACPIAQPDGPPPRRYSATGIAVELVGFHVEGAAGGWTHHDRRSHLHALVPSAMGHLDAIGLRSAVLLLPRG